MAIVEKIEEYAQRTGKTVLYALSYWDFTCKRYLETGQRFDQELVDWFKGKGLPCVDLLECHRQEYEEDFKCSVDKYTARYWNSHYAPNGNAFCAWAVLPSLLDQLRGTDRPPVVAIETAVGASSLHDFRFPERCSIMVGITCLIGKKVPMILAVMTAR